MPLRSLRLAAACAALALVAACKANPAPESICPVVPTSQGTAPGPVTCRNDALTAHDRLVILAPHPDDEVLGFAGLMTEFQRQGKPVSIVVVTRGDAYCDACAFWKNAGVVASMTAWAQCTEADLAAFSDVRLGETRATR